MKAFTVLIAGMLLLAQSPLTLAQQPSDPQFAQKVKNEIAKLGTGPDARVEVKLRDKTKLKGHISEVGGESFAVVDDKTGSAKRVLYPQVKQVKGNNLSTGAAIAIGIAIGVGLVVLLAFIGTKVAQ